MSDQYIVSARKYRPQTFDTVVGQDHITTTLKNALKTQHLAHAFLFCGPRGVGKTTCARILAKTINCETPTADMESCGQCSSCKAFESNASFSVFELDAASNNSVEDIRELTDQVRFAPTQGKYKVYIIDEVHMLSSQAFNAFLKTLEEPPSYAIFILATTEKHKILPTILSRCQIFDFKRITTNDTVDHLLRIAQKEHIQCEEEALHLIAQKSEGCMRDALSILDTITSFTNGQLSYQATLSLLNQLDAEFYFALTDNILAGDVASTLLTLEAAIDRGFEGDVLLNGLAAHFRNLLLCKDARMAKLLDVPATQKPIFHEKANQTPPSFLLSALNLLNESELNYKSATNKRLHTELCLIRLCYILQEFQAIATADEKKNDFPVATPAPKEPRATTPAATPAAVTPPVAATPPPALKVPEQPRPAPSIPESVPQPTGSTAPISKPASPFSGTPGAAAKRVSRDLLQQAAGAEQQQTGLRVEDLQLEHLERIIYAYKESLREAKQTILYSTYDALRMEMPEPGTLHLVSPNGLNDSNIQAEKSTLQELIRKETGLTIRITNAFEQSDEEPKETALSKTDIFEEMAGKNPILLQLKDALRLSIEY